MSDVEETEFRKYGESLTQKAQVLFAKKGGDLIWHK